MVGFQQKCEFKGLKCGKLRWKCEKLGNLRGFACRDFNFSTRKTRGKVEKSCQSYTNAENRGVEKNKFSTSHLTEIMQKKRFYSSAKKIFLCILHKNQPCFRYIKAPVLKNRIDKIMCSRYAPIVANICKCSWTEFGNNTILTTDNSARIIARKSSLITLNKFCL